MKALAMAEAARWYARHGLHVFPLLARGKAPACQNGLKDATTDPDLIAKMWPAGSTLNIAIATGPKSGIAVLDIDGDEGEASLARLEAAYGRLPPTAAVRTGRGRHLIFRYPGHVDVRNSTSRLGKGLDVRGLGGYVAAPPSVHESGAVYKWIEDCRYSQLGAAPPPAWLLELMLEPTRAEGRPAPAVEIQRAANTQSSSYAAAALAGECEAVESAPEGTRNARLNQAAFNLSQLVAGGALSERTVYEQLISAARGCGLGEREAQRTIASGMTAGAERPRTDPAAAASGTSWWGRTTPETAQREPEWPEPSELNDLPPVPTWNDALLPVELRAWISDVAERMQCPPEYVAVGAIVALASVVGRGCGIRPKQYDDWIVVPNLFGAVVGPPSAMKTPALREAMRPLTALAKCAAQLHEARAAEREELNAQLLAAKEALRKAVLDGDDTTVLRKRYQQLTATAAAASAERRFIVSDSSIEKLGELLSASWRGFLVFRDELVGWLASHERQGHDCDRAFYLEAWNGTGQFVYDRIGRGTVRIESACVSILGGIQPGPLKRYLRAALVDGAGADGLMQRFQLLVYPDLSRSVRNVDRCPDLKARQRALEVYRRLADLTPEVVGADMTEEIPFVRFDRDAQVFFDGWLSELVTRLRAGNEHEAIEAHLTKYRSLMPSLALIFQLADHGRGPVSLEAAHRAAAWCVLLEAHARRVYASATAATSNAARQLLAKLRAGQLPNPFVARDVYRAKWSGLSDRATVEEAIEALEDNGWVRRSRVQTTGRQRVDVYQHPRIARPEAAE